MNILPYEWGEGGGAVRCSFKWEPVSLEQGGKNAKGDAKSGVKGGGKGGGGHRVRLLMRGVFRNQGPSLHTLNVASDCMLLAPSPPRSPMIGTDTNLSFLLKIVKPDHRQTN